MPEGELAAEMAAVESKLMEIDAKVSEIDALRADDDSPGGGDPTATAFPMVADPPATDAGAGWKAAGRFFRS
jgi:hypothetical protein